MERPEKRVFEPVQVGKTQIVRDVIASIPSRFLSSLRDNPNARACCRDVESSTISYFQTADDIEPGQADLIIITCNVCNAKHRRFAAAPKK